MVGHKLTLAYVGTAYHGWQRQTGFVTVQQRLEEAGAQIWGFPLSMEGSGRTDAGVHATGQVASFIAPKKLDGLTLRRAFNNKLPRDIIVTRAQLLEPTFHARFDVVAKTYEYLILTAPFLNPFQLHRVWHVPQTLDFPAMQTAAQSLIGEHDFAAFTSNPGHPLTSTVRHVRVLTLSKSRTHLRLRITADGFLYHMVRNIAGALIHVGRGKIQAADFVKILTRGQRSLAPAAAPPDGLYLRQVTYHPRSARLRRRALPPRKEPHDHD